MPDGKKTSWSDIFRKERPPIPTPKLDKKEKVKELPRDTAILSARHEVDLGSKDPYLLNLAKQRLTHEMFFWEEEEKPPNKALELVAPALEKFGGTAEMLRQPSELFGSYVAKTAGAIKPPSPFKTERVTPVGEEPKYKYTYPELLEPYHEWEAPWGVKGLLEEVPYAPLWAIGGVPTLKGLKSITKIPGVATKLAEAKTILKAETGGGKLGSEIPKIPKKVTPVTPEVTVPKVGKQVPKIEQPPIKPTQLAVERATARDSAITKLKNLLAERKPARLSIEEQKKASKAIKAREMALAEAETTENPIERLAKVRAAQRGKEAFYPEYEAVPTEALSKQEVGALVNYIDNHPLLYDKIYDRTNFNQLIFDKLLGWGNKAGGVPTKGEYKMLEQVFGYDFAEAVKKHGFGTKITRTVVDALGLPKAIKAFLDFSFALRQTIWYGVGGQPKVWGKRFIDQMKAVKGENYERFIAEIKGHPDYDFARQSGMDLTERGGAKTLTTAEESMPTRLTGWIPGMKQSEQAALVMSNGCRFDTFYSFRAFYGNSMSKEQYKELAKLLMAGSGRGYVPKQGKAVTAIANRVFFSPRFHLGLGQMVYYPLVYIKNPMVRKFAMRSWSGFIGLNGSLAGIGKATGLWDVELNPNSASFGQARIGDTRFDLFGGLRSWVVLASRLATGKTKTPEGRETEYNRWDALLNTLIGKTDPVAGFAISALRGRTYLGEELLPTLEDRALGQKEVSVGEWARQGFAPLAVNDIWEAYENDRLRAALIAAPSAMYGATVSSYPSRIFDKWADWVAESTSKDWDNDNLYSVRQEFNKANEEWLAWDELEGSRLKDEWRASKPETEAKMYFWGVIKDLSSPEAVKAFRSMLDSYGLTEDSYPIDIIRQPYDKNNKPEVMFADLVDSVPKYLADYMIPTEKEWTSQDMPTLIEKFRMQRLAADKLFRKYEFDTMVDDPKKMTLMRESYKMKNPELDANLALWGKITTVKTRQAMEILINKAKELGIPPEIIPALSKISPRVLEQGLSPSVTQPKGIDFFQRALQQLQGTNK